jgi:trimeric autotransporter adhesin
MKSLQILLGLLLAAGAATAQQYSISTIAGIGTVQGYFGDTGPATSAQLDFPLRVTVDSKGNFYFADYYTYVVREVSGGTINTVVGIPTGPTFGFLGDGGPAIQADISDVHGLAVDSSGNIYIADTFNGVVRKVTAPGAILTPAGVISTFAGVAPASGVVTQGYSGDGGPATVAELSQPSGVAVDSSGNVYIADYGNYTVRKVDTTGKISTIAGTGTPGYSGDGGPANKALLASPYAIAIDPSGNIYISDLGNTNIREITTDGNIHTVVSKISTDSIAVDAAGSIYFTDSITNTVGKILSNGTQFAIAGIPGSPGFSGDGGPGTSAQLNQPHGVALDSSGNVYVADSQNQAIRMLSPVSSSITVVNSASGVGVSITPGEIVTIFGMGLGPSTGASAQPGGNGVYGKQLAGTTVSFGGTNGVVLYTSATQVEAIVPYSVPIGGTADITVTYQGQSFTAPAVPIVSSVPGIFTSNTTGTGQAAAVNQDGSINGPTSPAPAGSVISFYVTGEGQTTPAGVDGQPASAPLPKPVLPVTVKLNGQSVPVTYAGGAPGQVAGLMQVNALIPVDLLQVFAGPVAVPVVIEVGFVYSQPNVTITVSQ